MIDTATPTPADARVIELLPCPFCGTNLRPPTAVEYPHTGLARLHPGSVDDDECPLSGWGFYEHQLEAWNTRTALTAEIAEGATGAGNARVGESIPYDVARLVVAARLVVESDPRGENGTAAPGLTELNDAAEAFASRVCWDDGGGDIPEAHADPCTCDLVPPATPVGAIAEGRDDPVSEQEHLERWDRSADPFKGGDL